MNNFHITVMEIMSQLSWLHKDSKILHENETGPRIRDNEDVQFDA